MKKNSNSNLKSSGDIDSSNTLCNCSSYNFPHIHCKYPGCNRLAVANSNYCESSDHKK